MIVVVNDANILIDLIKLQLMDALFNQNIISPETAINKKMILLKDDSGDKLETS